MGRGRSDDASDDAPGCDCNKTKPVQPLVLVTCTMKRQQSRVRRVCSSAWLPDSLQHGYLDTWDDAEPRLPIATHGYRQSADTQPAPKLPKRREDAVGRSGIRAAMEQFNAAGAGLVVGIIRIRTRRPLSSLEPKVRTDANTHHLWLVLTAGKVMSQTKGPDDYVLPTCRIRRWALVYPSPCPTRLAHCFTSS